MSLKVLSLNVRGLVTPAKRFTVLRELERLDYDLFLLQETHVSTKRLADEISHSWPGQCFWSFGRGKSAGVALFVSPKFSGHISRFLFDSNGRVLSALVLLGPISLNIVNIYAPNTVSERKTFFECLHDYFISNDSRVIAGDFNCIDNKLDRYSANILLPDKKCLSAFLSDFCLIDVWRKLNPRGVSFTWSNSDYSLATRIDRFLVSRSLFKFVRSNKVLPCVFSDHDFVVLDFSFDGFSNKRDGVWRLNTTLLADPEFKREISSVVDRQKSVISDFESLGAWWDDLKLVIRSTCINYCTRKRQSLNRERNFLTKRLIRAKNAFHAGDNSVVSELRDVESALSSLISREAEGAKIRSRAKWIEEGEKPTRYFFRLEQQRAEKNSFDSVVDTDGSEKTSQADIERVFVNFYRDLYAKDNSIDMQIQTDLIDSLEFSLNDIERASCEGLFTKDELFSALKSLQTGKSPGSDGLPTEFYLSFWDDLGDFLVLVLNERYRLGVLTYSQRESLLRLLYKKDDRRLPKNWRPISLLNTDYKLASKAITERLKPVMNSIVHRDQTCGVVGRSIFSNLQLIRDTLDMIDKTDEPGILVTLDQEKAFDRVDHEFLMRTLAKFGFGPSFCNWVALFYNDVFSRIICNGNLSMPVFLGRGVRQGCPLSPLLYVLVSEVLSTQIRRCKQIEGFQLPGAGGLQFKVSQYADDATNFVKSERSLCHLLRVVNVYEKGSGAKLNTTKSEAMWLGRRRTNGASPFGLTWVFKMKILGVYFSNGLVSVESDNWKSKLDKLQNVVNLWKQRELSFLGRAMIINALGASRFWHTAKIIIPPQWVVDSYDKIVWSFVWPGKTENVSRQRCCAPLRGGGLNVVDFRAKCAALRLSNFSSLRDDFGSQKWHFLARYFLGNRLQKLDTRFSFLSNLVPVSSTPSHFYRSCISLFQQIFDKHGALPDVFSCKNLYLLLVVFPDAAPRSSAAGFWGSVVGRPINRWASVWRKSRLKIIENKKNDLIWLIIHCAVRVRYTLKCWGVIDSDRCASCSRVETMQHCFVDCPRVTKVWDFFAPFLSRLLGSPFSLSFSSVLFPFSPLQSSPSLSLFRYLVAPILFHVWHARNSATFRNSYLPPRAIVDTIIKDIQLRIRGEPIDHVRSFWSVNDVLCKVGTGDKISFLF